MSRSQRDHAVKSPRYNQHPVLQGRIELGSFHDQACLVDVLSLASIYVYISSALSHSVMSDSLWPHGLQPATLFCPWGFSRQEYWGDLPNPRIKPRSPTLLADSLPSESPGKPMYTYQFSQSVVSDSLRPHGLQHARPPCPSPTSGTSSNSCPPSQWCHPTISSSVIPFSSCLQSFSTSESSPVSQFFASGGQSIGVSTSASVLPMNIQDWFPLGWTGWISLLSKGLSRVFSNTTVQRHQFFHAKLPL